MKKFVIIVGSALIIGIAWYALSPLFMNRFVNDALPVGAGPLDTGTTISVAENERREDTMARSPVIPTVAHPASGFVRVVAEGTTRYVRYEDYKTINGPDVRVYLATDIQATDFVDLGPLRGTEGNINYPIPAGTDLSKYRYVLTWCEDFAVLFNSAELPL